MANVINAPIPFSPANGGTAATVQLTSSRDYAIGHQATVNTDISYAKGFKYVTKY